MAGLVGHKPDYSMVVIGADMGVHSITSEHIGIAYTLGMPLFVVVTKIDLEEEDDGEDGGKDGEKDGDGKGTTDETGKDGEGEKGTEEDGATFMTASAAAIVLGAMLQ